MGGSGSDARRRSHPREFRDDRVSLPRPDRGVQGVRARRSHGCSEQGRYPTASLEPGDEVTFSREGNAIRIERLASPDALMGRLAGHRLVKALEEERRAERRR
jgi:hypothetical protein